MASQETAMSLLIEQEVQKRLVVALKKHTAKVMSEIVAKTPEKMQDRVGPYPSKDFKDPPGPMVDNVVINKIPNENFVARAFQAAKVKLEEPEELWVDKKTFIRVSGLALRTVTSYCNTGKIKKKGPQGKRRRYLLTPDYQNNLADGGAVKLRERQPMPFAGHVEHLREKERAKAFKLKEREPTKIDYDMPVGQITESQVMRYRTDGRFVHMAWLAAHCFTTGESFSVALDKIIGEHREKL